MFSHRVMDTAYGPSWPSVGTITPVRIETRPGYARRTGSSSEVKVERNDSKGTAKGIRTSSVTGPMLVVIFLNAKLMSTQHHKFQIGWCDILILIRASFQFT